MRIVAGAVRGRRLAAPEGRSTRPTSDRVREAVFNALVSLDAVAGATVVDLFAGSGALGLEALSRGAVRATFVESDRAALAALRANVAACGFEDRTRVVAGDVGSALSSLGTPDLVLVDPPYAFDDWAALTVGLAAAVPVGGVLVAESDREVVVAPGWEVLRSRTYGGTVVQIATRVGPGPATEPQEPAP